MYFKEWLLKEADIKFASFGTDGTVVAYIDGQRYVYNVDAIHHDGLKKLSRFKPGAALNQIKTLVKKGQATMQPVQRVSFFVDKVDGGRAKAGIAFSQQPPQQVVNALRNVMDDQGMDVQDNGRVLKFYQSSNHVNDTVFAIAKQVLHRFGYQRFDDVWHDKTDADELFGYDLSK